ncbi:molybdenum cofactor biosynthesis protein B [Colwellia sp. MB3u-70]|uniref:molybdenum cofactor biosynthesis protein B n=1 Tax=unclassified Colwellia TaxID=196834 RepID=UPI0015F4B60B|nr:MULTISPECIES: molybdenum cofactor biosynthesis protein B [unclassified Colwellia]MBA6292559.1 molybdenum cofactor biosynthesis protein B [Colwellia sp. MB3u-8]MBA6307354.1 molybdenum cofactor biosynthesis protein B [Colwellia sp. MB3u-70]
MSSKSSIHCGDDFVPLNIAVLTVSDTREEHNDTSGQALVERLQAAGHTLAAKAISKDDVYQLRAVVSQWIADDAIQVILTTGGTGFTARDNTPEALLPLFDKDIEGFGEVFRTISLAEIGTSTIQSRAFGGMANSTVILSVPGSTNACKTAWDKLIVEQLDAGHRPCNFVPHLKFT